MRKQLIAAVAVTALAVNVLAEGSALTASSTVGSQGSDKVSELTLSTSTWSVDLGGSVLETLRLDSRLSKDVSTSTKNASTSAIGADKDKGLRGSVTSTGATIIPLVASTEGFMIDSATGSVQSVAFHTSDKDGFVRVSARGTSEAAKSALTNFVNLASVAGQSLAMAVSKAGEVSLVTAPSKAWEQSKAGEIPASASTILVAPSQATSAFSTTMDEVSKAEMQKRFAK
jgi:hypothetical protein